MSEEIIHKAKTISAVYASVAAKYSENQDHLVDEVHKVLAAHADIKRLIGQKPLSVMYDTHMITGYTV
jgi:hypothetical protein